MTRLYRFVRHAEAQTSGAVHDFATFRADMLADFDPPLTDNGIRQARQLGMVLKRIGVQAVVPSPMTRARQTACYAAQAAAIALGPPLDDLREVAVGTCFDRFAPWIIRLPELPLCSPLKQAIGTGIYNMASLWSLIRWRQGKTKDGESVHHARQRIRALLNHLDRMPLPAVALIGHAFWLFCLARTLAPPLGWRLRWFGHASITTVAADGHGRYRLVELARPLHRLSRHAVPMSRT